jgi:hypothetical protein
MLSRYTPPFLVVLCAMAMNVAPAHATSPRSGWELTSATYPTNISPNGKGLIGIDLYNIGAEASSGAITVTDILPPGLVATEAGEILPQQGIENKLWKCSGITVVTCVNEPGQLPSIKPGDNEIDTGLEQIGIAVQAEAGLPEETLENHVTVVGGGALAPASAVKPITISSTPAGFGLVDYDGWFANSDGTLDTQAGSHPYGITISFDLASASPGNSPNVSGGEVRSLEVKLPPGVIGDPNATPQCTSQQLDEEGCSAATQIGVDTVGLGSFLEHPTTLRLPVFNMVPPPGIPAQFAFSLFGVNTFLDAGVRSDGDYGITEHIDNITQRDIISNTITVWGVPADPSHDAQRDTVVNHCESGCSAGAALRPLLTLPTSCAGPRSFAAHVDAWEDASLVGDLSFFSHDNSDTPLGFTGCDHLSMRPSIGVAPDISQADTPAGLTVDVKVPQEGLTNVQGLSSADIKDTTVTLPEGIVINPGQAAGLAACQPGEDGVGTEGPPSCPAASKVGTVAITTPLLTDKLEGNVYVLQSNPPNLQLLVAASGEGVNLKLVGDVHLDEKTGRLTTTFKETPELPFTDFKLSFSGGAQAALATPTKCGSFTTTSDFTPWSTPASPDAFPEDSFVITAGPGGSPCVSSLPFSPVLTAGSTTDQAGGFTSFSLLLQRGDGQQRIQNLQFKTPEGLLGMISKIPLCGEPQAAEGKCSAASQIGHTVVAAGPGPYPLVVPQPGEPPAPIYLTGGYKGAPYGLSIAVPVITGPFNLGTVVVRAKIEVDPLSTQLTVTTDPLPAILDGIPTDLRTINAVIDKPGFMFNPTSCESQAFSGTATSIEGTQAPISSHFQMGSCRALTFKPNFKVSTSGRTSRANGASLDAKILYPTGELGANQASSQSNVKSVKVDLPKQLPSRLTTLQKACPSATFEANPAGCPTDSRVGTATAITPVLPVTLTGPAYFVSYGGAKFPELVIVLQGYGVTVYLHGETFISKAGITSSTFRKVPDVPITSFDLNLPEGKYSALAANGNLCKTKLKMPTVFTAQDGAIIKQSTPIAVTGCTKAKTKIKKHKAKKASSKRKKK